MKQNKTTTQPLWDPKLWTDKEVKGIHLTLERNGKRKIYLDVRILTMWKGIVS